MARRGCSGIAVLPVSQFVAHRADLQSLLHHQRLETVDGLAQIVLLGPGGRLYGESNPWGWLFEAV